MYLLSV